MCVCVCVRSGRVHLVASRECLHGAIKCPLLAHLSVCVYVCVCVCVCVPLVSVPRARDYKFQFERKTGICSFLCQAQERTNVRTNVRTYGFVVLSTGIVIEIAVTHLPL